MDQTVESEAESIPTIEVPSTFAQLADLICHQRRHVLQHLAQKSKSRELDDADAQKLLAFFGLLQNIEMTPKLKNATKLDLAMAVVLDREKYHFPEPFRALARNLQDRWISQNWGEEELQDEPALEDQPEPAPATTSAAATGQVRESPASLRTRRVVRPRRDHPIYGEHGIMRGILQVHGQQTAYQFDAIAVRRNPSVFGHNGIEVGAWWPLQFAALRDGVHGHRMGGIYGKAREGAYSIVISGMYADIDEDRGHTVFYSGANSHTNTDPDRARPSAGASALTQSIATARPVRVIRSSRSGWVGAPCIGLRYDGLYRVTSARERRNALGGLYVSFELHRLADQPDIDRSRPTRAEQDEFPRVKLGYEHY